MTPSRQSPACALLARRPIVPQPSDVLAADPPASQEPFPPSGTEDTAERRLAKNGVLNESTTKDGPSIAHLNLLGGREKQNFEHLRETNDLALAWPPETGLRIKVKRQYRHCTRGGGPQILSAFVKQRTYRRDSQQRLNRTSSHRTLW
jgi:hypothetical protein